LSIVQNCNKNQPILTMNIGVRETHNVLHYSDLRKFQPIGLVSALFSFGKNVKEDFAMMKKRGKTKPENLRTLPVYILLAALILLNLPAEKVFAQTTANSVTLHWTAPGDDSTTGTAALYDIRYSASAITPANWSSAIQVTGEPTPHAAGTAESMLITGLQPATTYYFAIKAADEAGNWSGLSNIATITTANEQIPPASITTLAVTNRTGTTITLKWTATGDDSTTGTCASYDIRYSTSVITEANWASATQVSGEPTPHVAGTQDSMVITGLTSNRTYYFAIKASDEVPNVSGLSNVVSATTLDIIPPATILDLSAITGVNPGEISLSWTAPGDDALIGTASAYVIKAALREITEANFDSFLSIDNPPAPLAGGSSQQWTLSDLAPGMEYHIAIKTIDAAGNQSALSNIAVATAKSFGADGINELAGLPESYALNQNYPNPFNPTTSLKFSILKAGKTRIEIFDALGRSIKVLVNEYIPAGNFVCFWDGTDADGDNVASAVYFVRLTSGEFSQTRKMTLLR
jgi:chitodextrinase